MKRSSCDREAQILEAARQGALSDSLLQHATTCQACSNTLAADKALRLEAGSLPSLDTLPDPTLIWWRARQRAQLQQVQRATLPIQIVERFALACGGFGLAIGLTKVWPTLRSVADRWISNWLAAVPQSLPLEGSALLLAFGSTILLLLVFGLYSQWAEG